MSFELACSQLQIMESIKDPRAMICLAVRSTRGAYEMTEGLSSDDEDGYGDEALDLQRPTVSPYAVDPVILQFGGQVPGIPVSRDLLNFEPFLLSRMKTFTFVGNQFKFIELGSLYADIGIGHMLVHFIHTWLYKTLQCPDGHPGRYRRSALAYAAAKEFDIRHLGEKAMKRMKCFSDAVHIYQILDIAQEVWHILSADLEYWIYLETMIVTASRLHENLFMTEPFLNHFEPSPEADNGFGIFLAAVMARAYSHQLLLARGEQVEQIAFPICPCKRHAGKPRPIE